MLKLTYAHVTHPMFNKTLATLANQKLPVKVTHDLSVFIKRVEKTAKEADEMRFAMLKKYCVVDEAGNLVPSKDEEGKDIAGSVQVIEEKKPEFMKEWSEYLKTEAEIKGNKIPLESIANGELSVKELEFLAPIIEGMEEV